MADIVTADPSVFARFQVPDYFGKLATGFEKGQDMQANQLKMSELATQNKVQQQAYADDQATREAMKNNLTQNPDGSTSIDTQGAMSDLADAGALNPKTIDSVNQIGIQQIQRKAAMIQNQMKINDATGQLLGSAKDQTTYESALDSARRLGLPGVEQMPKQYDPSFVNSMMQRSMSAKDQLAQAQKQTEIQIAQQNANSKQLSAQAQAGNAGLKVDQGNERIHNQNVNQINDNPQVTSLVTTANNLQNAISNFQKGGATPQEFNELQQAVRANAGIKGAGGVSERDETYLKSLGLSATKMNQFLTGDPKSVLESDPAFAKQILGVANLEIQNKQKQASQAVDQLAQGHQSFYSKPQNASRASDYQKTVQAAKSRIVAPPTNAHPQDDAMVSWAKRNPNAPGAKEVLKANEQ